MSFANGLKTIVAAADLDGRSESAIAYARKFAQAYGARIVLAHGLDPVEYAAVGGLPGRVRKRLTEEARAALEKMAAELIREGIHSHSEIRQGVVTQTLVGVARQYEAGLMVIGTHGRQGAGAVAVGSVAEEIVRHAPCPVLAIADDWNAGEFRPVPGGPVLLAMERNESTPAAIATACSLAETFERMLLVVHARRPAEAAAFLNPCATTLAEFGITAEGRFPVRCIVRDGSPADVVDDVIAQHHPSILVTGAKRSSSSHGPHGTAFSLLARSRVPVLCVPPELPSAEVEAGTEFTTAQV